MANYSDILNLGISWDPTGLSYTCNAVSSIDVNRLVLVKYLLFHIILYTYVMFELLYFFMNADVKIKSNSIQNPIQFKLMLLHNMYNFPLAFRMWVGGGVVKR